MRTGMRVDKAGMEAGEKMKGGRMIQNPYLPHLLNPGLCLLFILRFSVQL